MVFAADKQQAATAGFDDAFIYNEITLPYNRRKLNTEQIALQEDNAPFDLWRETENRMGY